MAEEIVSKFCVGCRSQSPNTYDMESNSSGKPGDILPWPECQAEVPGGEGGNGDDIPTTLPTWPDP